MPVPMPRLLLPTAHLPLEGKEERYWQSAPGRAGASARAGRSVTRREVRAAAPTRLHTFTFTGTMHAHASSCAAYV